MTAVADDNRAGFSSAGSVDSAAAVLSHLNYALYGRSLGANDSDNSVGVDGIAEAYIEQFQSAALLKAINYILKFIIAHL